MHSAIHADRLESIHGLVRTEQAREFMKREDMTAHAGDHEEGRPAAGFAKRDNGTGAARLQFPIQYACELLDGGSHRKSAERQGVTELSLDLDNQPRGQE